MKKERQNKLLYIFLSYKTINKYILKNHLEISFKTLERDISELNDFLKPIKAYINKIDDTYALVNPQTNLILDFTKLHDEFLLISERLIFIMLEIYKNEKVLQTYLLEDLDIGKNILLDDLQMLDIILRKYHLKLVIDKKGVSINDFILDAIIPIVSDIVLDHLLVKKNLVLFQNSDLSLMFSEYIYNKLVRYFKIDNFKIVHQYLLDLIIDKKNLSEMNIVFITIKITFYLNHSKNKLFDITNKINFEKGLKCLYMSSDDRQLLNTLFLEKEAETQVTNCVAIIKENFAQLFNQNIVFDNYIEERITKHLIANLFIQKIDPLLIEHYKENLFKYKNTYYEIFKIINDAIESQFLEQEQNLALVYEIFMHLIIWLNIQFENANLKILTICIGGMGQSYMIKSYLQSLYPQAEIETSSLSSINKKIFSDYNLVISMINIEDSLHKNLIQVSLTAFLGGKTETNLMMNSKIYEHFIGANKIHKVFSIDNVLINQQVNNKEEGIMMCGNLLKELGYVTDDYIKSMLQRERQLTTYIGNYIAIPHGLNTHGIIENGIVLLHFKSPVYFDKEPVYFLVGLAGKDKEYFDAFYKISNKLLEINFIEELLKDPSKERIFKEFEL